MKLVILAFVVLAALLGLLVSSVITQPYYGPSVVQNEGDLVCGLHRVPVKSHDGFIFNGSMTFVDQESMNFASNRFPNTLNPTFSNTESKWSTLSFTDYTCSECEAGRRSLDRLPMWYKRIIGWPAKIRRENQIDQAASKAQRTGNPDDARVQDGDGNISRIR